VSARYPIEIAGQKWATDGHCLVGEGFDLPEQWMDPVTKAPAPWLTRKGWAKNGAESQARAEVMMARKWSPGMTAPALETRVHRRFGAMLRTAERIDLYTEQEPPGDCERAVLVRAFRADALFFCCVVLHYSYADLGPLTERDRLEFPTVRELLLSVTA